jgi:Relaxase/Mobilisation nuclease domain
MTSRYSFCHSFAKSLDYFLEDKEQRKKQELKPEAEERMTRNRAEVLYYHQCYGDKAELNRQFREVQKQNLNVRKPAFHLSLNLPPEEKISKGRFVDLAKDCAKALDFERHQYMVIQHKDTEHSHIHLVVNRIGFDSHRMDSDYILKRIDQFCREAELKYQLTPVESMRRYRPPEKRIKPSQSQRVIQLKEEITQTLRQVQDLASFKTQMQERGYKVHKTERGIAFTDRDGVSITGSKADFAWKKIEAGLAQNLAERQAQELKLAQQQPERKRSRGMHR